MEAEDIKKLAARLSKPEKDVALALKTAKDDVAEAEKLLQDTIFILKGCYSARTNRLNGGIVVIANSGTRKIQKVRGLATYDTEYGNLSLDQPWDVIEKKIFEAEMKQNFVPAISHDLVGEIEFGLQDAINEFLTNLAAGSSDEINTRIRRIICTCLGDSDVEIDTAIEKMTPLALKIHDHEISPEGDAAPAGGVEGAADGAGVPAAAGPISEDRSLIVKTDVILSPVAGIPVNNLNPGDYILVKITDTRPQAVYVANLLHANDGNKMLPVRVPIRKIDRSDSGRLNILTEFGPGVYGRTVVQEGLKIKCSPETGGGVGGAGAKVPAGQTVLILGLAVVVLLLLAVAVYYFISLI